MRTRFDVKVLKSEVIYEKHGRKVVVDTLELANGTRHEWGYFGGTEIRDKPTRYSLTFPSLV
jgi:hypothetical protein